MYRNLSPRALGFSGTVQSEIIELALTYGFRGMDLDIADFGQQVADFGMDHARRLIDSAKLKIGNVLLPVRLTGSQADFEADMKRLPGLMELATQLGCTRVLTVMEPANDERSFQDNFEFHRKRLAEIGAVLESKGAKLAVEFMGPAHLREGKQFEFIHDLDTALKLIQMVGSSSVGLLVDVWHLYTSGGSVEDIRKIPADKVVSVQLADAPADIPREQCKNTDRRLPGETGAIDCVLALEILRELGYDGPITPEPLGKKVVGQGREAAVRAAGQALKRVWEPSTEEAEEAESEDTEMATASAEQSS